MKPAPTTLIVESASDSSVVTRGVAAPSPASDPAAWRNLLGKRVEKLSLLPGTLDVTASVHYELTGDSSRPAPTLLSLRRNQSPGTVHRCP